jgi:hypothetical protein
MVSLDDLLRETRSANNDLEALMAMSGASDYERKLAFAPELACERAGLPRERYMEIGFKIDRGVPLSPSDHRDGSAFAKAYSELVAELATEYARGGGTDDGTLQGHLEQARKWRQLVAAMGSPDGSSRNKYTGA